MTSTLRKGAVELTRQTKGVVIMKWVLFGLVFVAALLILLGHGTDSPRYSVDVRSGAIVAYALAAVVIVLDIVIGLGWAIWAIAHT